MIEPELSWSIKSIIIFILYFLIVLFVPFVGSILLPIIGARDNVIKLCATPTWYTPAKVVKLGKLKIWIDIFCKNQHGISSSLYSNDTELELRTCVQLCGKTILACSPWNNPICLQRIWCQYEV